MNINQFLLENEQALSKLWVESLIRTYPEEGAKFFSGTNQFANPVGHTFRNNVEKIMRVLVRGGDVSECSQDLDGIMRIRAVQGFTPSVALCFLPALKEIVHREAAKSFPPDQLDLALREISMRIDQLTMLGFDLYMGCREILWKQKANQLYSRTHKLLEKAKLLQDEEVTE